MSEEKFKHAQIQRAWKSQWLGGSGFQIQVFAYLWGCLAEVNIFPQPISEVSYRQKVSEKGVFYSLVSSLCTQTLSYRKPEQIQKTRTENWWKEHQ